jgi:hypothetical protein
MNTVSGMLPKLIILLLSLFSGCIPSNNQPTETQKREVRLFSRYLSIYSYAILVDQPDDALALKQLISREISQKCLISNAKIVINSKITIYSIPKVPETVRNGGSCKVEVGDDGEFKSTVMGNASTGNFTSINGE